MNEYDKKLQNVIAKRFMFNSHINTLECEYPKLYKKLMPLLVEINQWMMETENYMNELNKSIDTLEAKKANDSYYMNQPRNILDTGKKDV